MTTRLITSEDYAMFSAWHEGHGGKAPARALLPKCGIVVENEDGPCAACYLYQDNSVGVAWLAWLVTKPGLHPTRVPPVLETLLDGVESVCRHLDYGLLFTMCQQGGLGRFLERAGFQSNHRGCTQYFKEVRHGS